MNEFFVFLKKNWKLLLLLFIVPLVVISIFYIAEYCLRRIDLDAGDWAGLLSATFGYWGTVILGVLSFWQNDKLSKANDKLAQLQLEEYTPYLLIKDAFVTKHIEGNRNPDTSFSILKGSIGNIEMSQGQRISYDSQMDKLMGKISFSDVSGLEKRTQEDIQKTYLEMAKLRQTLPRSKTVETFFDTFWILTNQLIGENKNDYYKLDDKFEDTLNFERKSIKLIFENPSSSNIKKIIINKIELSCGFHKWLFIPNQNRNEINDILSKGQELIFYLNLFYDKNSSELEQIITVFNHYKISLELKLKTVGNITQSEEISLDISFDNLSESEIILF